MIKNLSFLLTLGIFLLSCSKKEQEEPIVDSFELTKGYNVVQIPNGGTVTGRILLDSADTYLRTLQIQRDQEVCGASHPNPSRPGTFGGVQGCIVWLDGIKQGKDFAYNKSPEMDQVGCEFLPHTLIMRAGTSLIVHNSDHALHNFHVYNENISIANEAQPEGAPPREITALSKPGIYKAICDVHPWMRGFICVAEHPYYAITDSTGSFTLSDVPPGTYSLKVFRDNWHVEEVKNEAGKIISYRWHPDIRKEQPVTIEGGKTTDISFTLP